MIRPAALYNKARFARDFALLGRVIAVMCGNKHITRDDLTDSELSALEEIENENDEMERNLEKAKTRKAEYRAARERRARERPAEATEGEDVPKCPWDNEGQARTDEDNEGQARTTKDNKGQDGEGHSVPACPVVSTPIQYNTTNTTSTTNTNSTSINRTDADTHARTCAREAARSASASGSGRLKFNVYEMEDGEFFDGSHNVLDLYRAACGNGFWAKAVRAVGEGPALEELNTFVHEVRAGERVDNPGAVMSKRLRLLAESKGAKIA